MARRLAGGGVGRDAMIPVARPWLGEAETAAVGEVLASGWVAQGPRVAAFERALAGRVGAAAGVAVSSCTAGLHLALLVAGVRPGDDVVVPSLSFIATASVVRHAGATPMFADVDAGTLNVTPETIERALTPRTRAVVVVHQAGVPADLDGVHALCDPRSIAVVEDAACALGSTYRGRPIGARADLVAFSFHPRKLITTGEGGMVVTSRDEHAERLRRLRDHGVSVSAADRHDRGGLAVATYVESGFNYRMSDVQAAIGLAQLQRLDAILARRRALADRYRRLLSGVPGVETVADPPHGETNYQTFWIGLSERFPVGRDDVLGRMSAAGIGALRGIMASHLEPAFAGLAHGDLSVTEGLARRSLVLPLYHELSEEDQDRVVAVLRRAAGLPTVEVAAQA